MIAESCQVSEGASTTTASLAKAIHSDIWIIMILIHEDIVSLSVFDATARCDLKRWNQNNTDIVAKPK
jgi:hypothetical protein